MRLRPGSSILLLAPVLLALTARGVVPAVAGPEKAAPADGASTEIALKYRSARDWTFDLPAERFAPISGALDFRKSGGKRFVVALDGSALAVDTDGDGKTDVKVTGKAGFVRLTTEGEKPFAYAVRLAQTAQGWTYAAGGSRVGKIGSTKVTLLDQDGDGCYDGYGRDAMIVGSSKNACFLSRVVNVAGVLHRIEVAKDGRTLRHKPYKGKAGTLDLTSKWTAKAKLQSAIIRSQDGQYSFDVSRTKGPLRVPAATYVLHSGKLGLGENVVRFTTGRAKPIAVADGAAAKQAAGGPVTAEFDYARQGEEVVFSPASLRYFGQAGEAYTTWQPFGKSPVFTVTDTKARKEIAKAIFTGT